MNKAEQLRGLLRCSSLLNGAKIWESPGSSYFWTLVKYAHKRGWLYVGMNGEEIDACVIAYKVSGVTEADLHTLPEEDSGDTLYVLVAVSRSKDIMKLNKIKKLVLEENPDVRRIALHHRGNKNDLRIYEVNREIIKA